MASSRARQSPAKYPRVVRVNEVLREVIAEEIERHSDEDPRLEMVTVTGIDADPDLRHARVYFSAMGNEAKPEEVIAALESLRVGIQASINKDVHMKRTPQLSFVADPAILEGERVEEILRQLPKPQEDAEER